MKYLTFTLASPVLESIIINTDYIAVIEPTKERGSRVILSNGFTYEVRESPLGIIQMITFK